MSPIRTQDLKIGDLFVYAFRGTMRFGLCYRKTHNTIYADITHQGFYTGQWFPDSGNLRCIVITPDSLPDDDHRVQHGLAVGNFNGRK